MVSPFASPSSEILAGVQQANRRPLLLLVEGTNDAEFLVRLSGLLYREQATPISLAELVESRRLIIVPFGGGISGDLWNRFAPLGCSEFHLYDREVEPQTSQRQQLVQRVNSRPRCRGKLTSKRSLENYLHPTAIRAAGGGELAVGDDDCVAQLLVRNKLQKLNAAVGWQDLSSRTRQRLTYRAKKWLNTQAASQMTPELLANRDPAGEVLGWLATIAELLGSADGGNS